MHWLGYSLYEEGSGALWSACVRRSFVVNASHSAFFVEGFFLMLQLNRLIVAMAVVSVFLAAPALAQPKLRLHLTPPNLCAQPGQIVTVSLSMADLGANQAAGFQAFLAYDQTKLTYHSGSYTVTPFGLPILVPIVGGGGEIDLAAGINQLGGQTPTNADATLATLNFVVATPPPSWWTAVTFRTNKPPTTLSTLGGAPITPLLLFNLNPKVADLNNDGVVGPADLGMLLGSWGNPGCGGALPCISDLNCDGAVGPADLGILLGNWG